MLLRHPSMLTSSLLFFAASAAIAQPPVQPPAGPAASLPTTTKASMRESLSPPASQPAEARGDHRAGGDALYASRSRDGLSFDSLPSLIAQSASAPTLLDLPEGRLLMVYERRVQSARPNAGRLACIVSADAGKTWSEPQPLVVQGLPVSAGVPRSPALVAKPNGDILLYMICRDRRARGSVFAAEIRLQEEEPAAASRPAGRDAGRTAPPAGGMTAACRILGRVDLGGLAVTLDDLVLAWIGEECHLYGTHADLPGKRYHGLSRDGRRFRPLDNVLIADVGTGGCIARTPTGYRLYGALRSGVVSAVSPDGKTWSHEAGIRLPGGDDPAVVRLTDDSWLMVYGRTPSSSRVRIHTEREEPRATAGLRKGNSEQPDGDAAEARRAAMEGEAGAEAGAQDAREAQDAVTGEAAEPDQPLDEAEGASAAGETAPDGDPESGEAGEGMTLSGVEDGAPVSPEARPGESGEPPLAAADAADYQGFEYTSSGVPIPDFVHRVDYLAWLRAQHDPDAVPDNAWHSYAAFMFDPLRGSFGGSALPTFSGMAHTQGFTGLPGPWDPAEHPEWEEAYQIAAPYLEKFAEAAAHSNYVRPLLMSGDRPESESERDPELDRLLIGILLPDLSAHRALAKQAMSDVWRAPEGKPDPQAMFNGFDTCLSAANHLNNSDFLIERLVGIAEKGLVERTARFALQHGVFSADEMESTLELLIEKNQPTWEPGQWISGETAMSLDMTQYLFGVGEEGGGRTLRPDRVEKVRDFFGDETTPLPTAEEIAATTAEQVAQNFVNYADYYSQMASRGYPEVKAKDLDEMTARHVESNYVSRMMLPSLSRVYKLVHRQEASRRATQLSYAIHLHKARTGQWPQSLDELPPRYTQGARTDPFSGRDFVYHPTTDGFTLYSTSENGIDDGGAHHPRWDDESQDDPTDDHVFWPPQ